MLSKTVIALLGCAVMLTGVVVYTATRAEAAEAVSSQNYTPARYAVISGPLDVVSEFNNQPYTMNAMLLLNTETGQVWMLQANVRQQNEPELNSAFWYPVLVSREQVNPSIPENIIPENIQ
ncbi:hypothetical protein [Victivallis sp. Marseille-Q1083]|uniref:hypothetical protein n=1 Tax=Victivallis sp. Marseille-Q1083 TaxID=2717288 RepID=UPI00158CF96D|nr:hypothetical protein [Victivallis sp. Marseille-Q1083]